MKRTPVPAWWNEPELLTARGTEYDQAAMRCEEKGMGYLARAWRHHATLLRQRARMISQARKDA